MVNLQLLKNEIKTKMVEELSGLGYGYTETVKGCFDATQSHSRLVVPEEHLEKVKKECVSEVTMILQTL